MGKNPYQVYDAMSKETMSGRDLEAHVLTKAANKIKAGIIGLEEKKGRRQLNEALTYNQRIWGVLQAELADENNALPLKIRQDLLNLSLFVDQHTFKAMAYPDRNKLHVLIDINLNIASGLRETRGTI